MVNKYNWDKDLIEYFKFNSNYQSKGQTIADIASFVENEIKIPESEDEQDYIDNLTDLVFPIEPPHDVGELNEEELRELVFNRVIKEHPELQEIYQGDQLQYLINLIVEDELIKEKLKISKI